MQGCICSHFTEIQKEAQPQSRWHKSSFLPSHQPIPRLQTRTCEQRISNNTGIVGSLQWSHFLPLLQGTCFHLHRDFSLLVLLLFTHDFTSKIQIWGYPVVFPPGMIYRQLIPYHFGCLLHTWGNHFMIWWSGAGVKPSTISNPRWEGSFARSFSHLSLTT